MLSQHARRLVAEALGTFTLVAGISLTIFSVSAGGEAVIITVAFGCGLALLAGLYAFAEVSGGHFNPAVSLAMMMTRRLSPQDFVAYVIAQVIGAILASLAMLAAFDQDQVGGTTNRIVEGHSDWDGLFLEFLVTAIFVAVILQATRVEGWKAAVLIAIPLTLVFAHIALIPVTGCSVNPARSIAPVIVGNENWGDLWVFIVAPLAGGALAAAVHSLVYPPPAKTAEAST